MIPIRILLRRRACRLGLVAAAALVGASSAAGAPRFRGPVAKNLIHNFAAEGLASDSLRPSERTFLEKAAALSRDELRLARLAVSQATSSEVKAFAQQMAGDQQQISDSVDSLRRKKGSAPAVAPEVVSEAAQKLAQKTGADFDREFVRVVADVHAEMVILFEQSMSDAKDTDVRELLGSYLPVLRDHQNKVNELRKALE